MLTIGQNCGGDLAYRGYACQVLRPGQQQASNNRKLKALAGKASALAFTCHVIRGLNKYEYRVEVHLRYHILELYKEPGTITLEVV